MGGGDLRLHVLSIFMSLCLKQYNTSFIFKKSLCFIGGHWRCGGGGGGGGRTKKFLHKGSENQREREKERKRKKGLKPEQPGLSTSICLEVVFIKT